MRCVGAAVARLEHRGTGAASRSDGTGPREECATTTATDESEINSPVTLALRQQSVLEVLQSQPLVRLPRIR